MFFFYFFISIFTFFSLGAEIQPLVIGMELSYPPFEFINEKGEPTGISVDLGKTLGLFLERPVKFENIAFVGLIPALKTHKIDLIISSLTITAKRKESILFSTPYVETGLSLLVNKNSPIQSVKDLNATGKSVAVKLGTSGELYAAKNLPLATVRVFSQESICVLEVVQAKVDAFIYDQLSVFRNWQRNPNTTRPLLKPFQKEFWGIGINQDNPLLLEKVNLFLEQFRKEGGFDKLAEKYLSDEKKAFEKLNIPFIFRTSQESHEK